MVVPEGALEIAPELVGLGKENNVFVCTYKDVFPVAHILQEEYIRIKEAGDMGKYRKLTEKLLRILDTIFSKMETIDRAVTQIENASKSVKDEVGRAKRLDYSPEEEKKEEEIWE